MIFNRNREINIVRINSTGYRIVLPALNVETVNGMQYYGWNFYLNSSIIYTCGSIQERNTHLNTSFNSLSFKTKPFGLNEGYKQGKKN